MASIGECGSVAARTFPRPILIWLAALLAVTVAVRVYEPTGWLGSDDAAYYSAAEHVLTGTTITRAHHHYARLAVIVPVAASVAVFGHHTWAVALPMFIASIACVFLVVVLGKLLFGWSEGLLAGLIVSVLPYFRVLSTTAYADTHVCLWVTAAVVLCVMGLRAESKYGRLALFIACGFALGLGVSSKVFAATALCGILALLAQIFWRSRRLLLGAGVAIAAGGFLFFLVEGAFYSFFAGDFFFSLHAHEQTQTGVPAIAAENMADTQRIGAIAWDRLTLLMNRSDSGWGLLGAVFWPGIILAFLCGGAARCMAIWAAGTFLGIAFAPVSLSGGYQPFPIFHGRHILPACIPFALCIGHLSGLMIARLQAQSSDVIWVRPIWPALAVLVLAIAYANPRELRGFCDRPTGRVGDAIGRMIPATAWDITKTIYMTPSTYWRFRILFPEHLRNRLRVAVADGAPEWWRSVTPDITERCVPFPDPRDAYLLVTPTQLEGNAESWDYGVTLPPAQLAAWPRDFWRGVLRDKSVISSVLPPTNLEDTVALLFGVAFPVATRDVTRQ